MKFRFRPFEGATCAEGSSTNPQSRFETPIRQGCRVTLCPDIEDFDDELYAEVLESNEESLRVRALHDFYVRGTERVVKFGDVFEIERAQVFAFRG